jgi:hypothetical protein
VGLGIRSKKLFIKIEIVSRFTEIDLILLCCLLKRDTATHVSGGQSEICRKLVPDPTAAVDV